MIDSIRIEEIRALPVKEAKAAMKAYAKELGVSVKAKTIDNMVSEMGAQLAAMNEPVVASSVDIVEAPTSTPVMATPIVVREVAAYVDPRAKHVTSLPSAVSPIMGKGFALYAQLNEIDNVDKCKFQWKKDGVDLDGATKQRMVFGYNTPDSSGSYTCTVTESDGTATDSSATIVGIATIPPKDFPMHTLFKPTWNDFYGSAFAHIGWKALHKAKQILDDSATYPVFVDSLSKDRDAFQIFHLTNMAPRLILTDARDGYPNVITQNTSKNNPIKEIGRWKK